MRRILPLLLLAFPAAAAGGISAPRSHATVSPDGRRVLVMLSADPEYDRREPQVVTLPDGRAINIRDGFARSGAYDARTLAPLWQVDWFSYPGELLWSDDFRSVVRLNRHGLSSDWALAFYEQGSLVRQYDCEYLLTRLRHYAFLPFTTWDWHTMWYGELALEGDRVHLSTARRRLYLAGAELNLQLQEFYTFDLATGSVVSRRTEGEWVLWVGGGLALAPVLVPAVAMLWRRRKRARRARVGRRHSPFPQ